MKKTSHSDPIGLVAAEWVLRHDRGLTAAEQDAFSQWLASDQRHRAAWAEYRWGWDEFDRLAGLQTSVHAVPNPDLLAPKTMRRFGLSRSLLAAAAAIAVGFVLWEQPWSRPAPMSSATRPDTTRALALIEQRELPDGSIVELNRGAVLTERFTSEERRVRLERGEAHFQVTADASRPFVVEAAGVAVRAVGTAFNVRLESAAVDVLVTEGKVSVAQTDVSGVPSPRSLDVSLVAAGERTVVSLASAPLSPQVNKLSPAEIEARLAWRPRLLDFTNAPLAEIVGQFNRRNLVRLTLGDGALGGLRLSATFHSDNVEGFVRLMASDFGMRAEWRGDREIVLVLAAPRSN